MAKKKLDDISSGIDSIINEIGKDIVSTGKELLDTKREVISFGPRLDSILNGGIPEGTLVLVAGKPKSCKSTSILHFLKNAQIVNRNTWYFDVESRLKEMNISGINGLNPEKLIHIKSRLGNLLTAEKVLTGVLRILKDDPGAVVVIDSLSALITEGEYTKDLSGTGRTDLHKLLSNFYKQASSLLNINKGILIGVNHIIANHAAMPGSSPWVESGSIKGQYYSDIRLRIKYAQLWKESEQVIGQTVNWICDCSALGAPGGECESYVRYGIGIDTLKELIMTGVDAGLIQKAGAWYSAPYLTKRDNEEHKFQGEAKLYAAISENKEWQDLLEKDLREMGAI